PNHHRVLLNRQALFTKRPRRLLAGAVWSEEEGDPALLTLEAVFPDRLNPSDTQHTVRIARRQRSCRQINGDFGSSASTARLGQSPATAPGGSSAVTACHQPSKTCLRSCS